MAGSLSDPLWAARAQDASAWSVLGAALLLAPWRALYEDLAGLPAPSPAIAWQAGGAVLLLGAVALWRARTPRAVTGAAVLDAAGAAVLAVWLASGPGLSARGTFVVAVVLASLVLQAAVDVALLLSPSPGSR